MPNEESATIEHPVFGTIKVDEDGFWVGLVHLPVFAGYDDKSYGDSGDSASRRTREQKRRDQQFAAGLFPLHLCGAENERPTIAQEKAFQFLVEHESQVVDAVMSYVFRVYSNRRDYWTLEGLQHQEDEFDLKNPDELKRLMRLSAVSIVEAEDDVAHVIFYFNSALDEEHGIEVTTKELEIEDDFPDLFPFDLPSALDASGIKPEPAGHRLVEFKHRGKWCGIYVLDDSLQCVGIIPGGFAPRGVHHVVQNPHEIEELRAVTRWNRWLVSPAKKQAVGWLTASNWLVSLPCLLVAWAFMPQLFWVSLALSVLCIIGFWLLREESGCLPIVQVAASIAGLVYASRSPDFGSQEHVAEVMGVYGSIVWWCVAAIDALAITVLIVIVATFNRSLIREGLGAVLPALLTVATLTTGLGASSFGYWSSFHLLWLTPLVVVASFALLFTGILTGAFEASASCPECGKPLRTPNAKQCFECGADWH